MFCQNCGKQIGDATAFCPYCGAKALNQVPVNGQAPAQPQVPVQSQAPVQPQIPVQQPVYAAAPAQGVAPAYPATVKKKSKAGLIVGIILGVIAFIAVIAIVGASLAKSQKKIVGEWETTMNLGDSMVDNMKQLKPYMSDSFSFDLDFVFTFNDDDTYQIVADETSFNENLAVYKAEFKAAFLKFVRDQYPDYRNTSDEELEEVLGALFGQNLDAYIDEALEGMTYAEFSDSVNKEGKYKVEEDKIFFSAGLDYAVDENVYAVYEQPDDDTVIITDYLDNGITDEGMFTLPLTLERVK